MLLAETIARHGLRQHLALDPGHAMARCIAATDQFAVLHDEDLLAAATYSDVITVAALLLPMKDPATWAATADTLVPRLVGSLRMANPPADRAVESSSMTNDQDTACHSI